MGQRDGSPRVMGLRVAESGNSPSRFEIQDSARWGDFDSHARKRTIGSAGGMLSALRNSTYFGSLRRVLFFRLTAVKHGVHMYSDTKIWQATLESRGDKCDPFRERLRTAFSGFRERVGQMIQTIPSDIPGLTVHDLGHLDALWEMADILTGGEYDLNPAEAFVLGGAILLHDSAMTVAAYRGGIEEIRSTPEYCDAVALANGRGGRQQPTGGISPDSTTERFALAEALRLRHATKAEELASQMWKSPIDESDVYLIDDSELRDHYQFDQRHSRLVAI